VWNIRYCIAQGMLSRPSRLRCAISSSSSRRARVSPKAATYSVEAFCCNASAPAYMRRLWGNFLQFFSHPVSPFISSRSGSSLKILGGGRALAHQPFHHRIHFIRSPKPKKIRTPYRSTFFQLAFEAGATSEAEGHVSK